MWPRTGKITLLMLMEEYMDVQELLQQATAAINEVAEETVGKEARKIKKKWISDETMTLLEQKRNLKGNRKKENEYRIIKKEVQTALRKDKELWLEQKSGEVEEMNKRHNTSGIYRTIREICERKRLQQACIKDKDGVVLTDVTEVLARIKEYTENLYKTNKRQLKGRQLLGNVEDEPEPLIQEVREAMKKLKCGK